MLFRRDTQLSVRQLYKSLPNKEISIIIASMYATLSPAEKSVYTDKAQRELQLHQAKYPNYKFRAQPSKPRSKPKKKRTGHTYTGMACFNSQSNFAEISHLTAEDILQTPDNGLSSIKETLFKKLLQ
ncbi:hypothetical protein DSO57_1028854 [Entomophthora muscae]|uniref:Uncharacterized protein n=1 Tax=Entomophthora muscae TaxID=34485 RepID=A0ACC2TD05_9FUNG|nr:hypothetical protein DSO57_1028854 [Entomophthora muscae]